MIRIVMFDLGLTLIDADRRPFPNAREALATIAGLKAGGKPLRSCLISDFTMPTPPVTKAKINALFEEYLDVLGGAGLRSFFEPVAKRVTLSTHAGVNKPHRAIFETALRRLGAKVPLAQCLFITEEPAHIQAARETLGMQALQFRSPGQAQFDFEDWAQLPALVASLVNPHHSANTKAAIKAQLSAQGVNAESVEPVRNGVARIAGTTWRAISVPGFDDLRDVQVAIPVEGEVTYSPAGAVQAVALHPPSADTIDEVVSYVRSLADRGQIAGRAGERVLRPTHQLETDAQGNRKLVRKRHAL